MRRMYGSGRRTTDQFVPSAGGSYDGANVLTIEGVARGDQLHPVQAVFIAHDGFQCGFCTPGQIMSAIGLIHEGQAGDDPERIREGMSGNLCRCRAYSGITDAVLDAQKASPKPTGGTLHEHLRLSQARDYRRRHRGRRRAGRRISGGRYEPTRPDEGRNHPSEPSRRCHTSAGARAYRASARRRHTHRRARSQCRSRARPGFFPILPGDRRGASVRRFGATSQCRDGRW
jgi:hypothetical protein